MVFTSLQAHNGCEWKPLNEEDEKLEASRRAERRKLMNYNNRVFFRYAMAMTPKKRKTANRPSLNCPDDALTTTNQSWRSALELLIGKGASGGSGERDGVISSAAVDDLYTAIEAAALPFQSPAKLMTISLSMFMPDKGTPARLRTDDGDGGAAIRAPSLTLTSSDDFVFVHNHYHAATLTTTAMGDDWPAILSPAGDEEGEDSEEWEVLVYGANSANNIAAQWEVVAERQRSYLDVLKSRQAAEVTGESSATAATTTTATTATTKPTVLPFYAATTANRAAVRQGTGGGLPALPQWEKLANHDSARGGSGGGSGVKAVGASSLDDDDGDEWYAWKASGERQHGLSTLRASRQRVASREKRLAARASRTR